MAKSSREKVLSLQSRSAAEFGLTVLSSIGLALIKARAQLDRSLRSRAVCGAGRSIPLSPELHASSCAPAKDAPDLLRCHRHI
jgi:hypothetical protein